MCYKEGSVFWCVTLSNKCSFTRKEPQYTWKLNINRGDGVTVKVTEVQNENYFWLCTQLKLVTCLVHTLKDIL